MTLDNAAHKAALLFTMVGAKAIKIKNGKIKIISRVTAFKIKDGQWDIAIFFQHKNKTDIHTPDCFLSDFAREYQVV
jgi:hypothetical protein